MGKKRVQAYADLGSSATKAVYWSGEEFQWLWMLPQFMKLTSATINRLSSEVDGAEPEAAAWVEVGETQFAVGALAQAHGGSTYWSFPKRDRAAYKLAAVVGAMAEKLNLDSEFELDLGVVLPIDEYWIDRQALKDKIAAVIREFSFRGKVYKVVPTTCQLRPEGLGLNMLRRAHLMNENVDVRNHAIVVLMFGHRNLSLLTFDKGLPPEQANSTSSGPGFIEILNSIAKDLSVGIPADSPGLLSAVLKRSELIRVKGRSELVKISLAMEDAFERYRDLVDEFLLEHLPDGDVELLVAGGAAYQIRDMLTSWFSARNLMDRVTWSDVLVKDFQYYLPKGISQIDAIRYCDVFGLFKGLIETNRIDRAVAA